MEDTKSRVGQLGQLLEAKRALDAYASVIEPVSDTLSTQAPDYAIGLDAETLAKYDADARRRHYLLLQENLCDLSLAARRRQGKGLSTLARRVAVSAEQSDMAFAAFFTDAKPDFLHVLMAARGLGRPEILKRAWHAVFEALVHYHKSRGMAIVDRNGQGYEVVLAEVDRHTPEAANFGALLFGELKITGSLASLLPFSDSFVLCEGGSQEP